MSIMFRPLAPIVVGSSPTSVTAADVNDDGKLDLRSANPGSGTVSVPSKVAFQHSAMRKARSPFGA